MTEVDIMRKILIIALAAVMTVAMSSAVFAVTDVNYDKLPQEVVKNTGEMGSYESITFGDQECLVCPIEMRGYGVIWTDFNAENTTVGLYSDASRSADKKIKCLQTENLDGKTYDETKGNGGYYVKTGKYYLAINENGGAGETIWGKVRIVYNTFTVDAQPEFTLVPNGFGVTMYIQPKKTGVYFVGGINARIVDWLERPLSDTRYGGKSYFGLKKGKYYSVSFPRAKGTNVSIMNVGAMRVSTLNKYAASFRTARKLPRLYIIEPGEDASSYDYDIFAQAPRYIGDKGARYVKIYLQSRHRIHFQVSSEAFNGREYVQIINSRGAAVTKKYSGGNSRKFTLSKGTYYVKFTKKYAKDSGMHSCRFIVD